ncbi:hypothetical protein [Rhodocyclus tenuis]|uniref:Uncharacterized protein n=1 Tax=Rhodocyclus tenuis TaxID=1066 RepID=A0A840GBB5_RHOTE|nr:hypothetical protein [Rhodocyclus tenuis]MBB4249155.1 hypothetical protein [Rhodocyclus tenuis]
MDINILASLILLLLIALAWIVLRKGKGLSPRSVALIPEQESDAPEIQPPKPALLDRIVIGSNPASPLVTIQPLSAISDFERSNLLDPKRDYSISRLSALCQAIPSLLVTGEASGKKIMEVVINGDLVRAADGNGLRAFAMNGKGIAEQARLFEMSDLQNMINAAAIWQIASVVVAQKHLADISRKLDEIKAGVQQISQFLASQRKSRVLATYDYLGQVYLAIKGGDLPDSSRMNLESCERDLLEIQHHLEIEYRQKVDKKVEHTETFGTENLTNDIGKKISELEELTGDIALCLKTRIAAWHVLSLFPGDPQLKVARRASIQKSIDSFSELVPYLEESLNSEIAAVNAFWNKGSTLDARKRNLKSKCMTAAGSLESKAKKCSEHVTDSEHILLEHDQPIRLYLQFENGELIGARQAA